MLDNNVSNNGPVGPIVPVGLENNRVPVSPIGPNPTLINSYLVKQKKMELKKEIFQSLSSLFRLKQQISSKFLSKWVGITTKKGNTKDASQIIEKNIFFLKRALLRKKKQYSLHILLWKFFSKIKPGVNVKRTRVSGRTVYVPSGIKFHSQMGVGLRWLTKNFQTSKKKKKKLLLHNYSLPILESLNKKGSLLQKKEELNKLAEKNRYFLRLSW